MKKILQILFLVAVYLFIFFGLYSGYQKINLRDIYSFFSKPCSKPITYKIGSFDNRFNVSNEEFLVEVNKAINIWEKPLGKKLFEYKDDGYLTINLIFDHRQEDSIKNSGLEKILKESVLVASSTNKEISSAKINYENKKQEYLKLVDSFNVSVKNYEDKVIYWNEKGGVPKNEYNKLQKEKDSLLSFQNEVEISRLEVNGLVEDLNFLIEKYNRIALSANSAIDDYNKDEHIEGEFRQGEYISDGQGKRINIYQFSDKNKLIRVLSHELGHALDVGHNDNPKSIMYRLNQGSDKVLSKEDLEALKIVCEI